MEFRSVLFRSPRRREPEAGIRFLPRPGDGIRPCRVHDVSRIGGASIRRWQRSYCADHGQCRTRRGRRGAHPDSDRLPGQLSQRAQGAVTGTEPGAAGADRKSTRLTPVTNAHLVCRLMLEKKKKKSERRFTTKQIKER